jgi:chloramphenicol O-acetyltransferase type A
MRKIDKQNWNRLEHYDYFSTFNHPHFNLCANVDLTRFSPYLKQHKVSFTVALVYTIARAANDIPEFRYRIHGEDVVEHATVSPSITVLMEGDLFSFCTIDYASDFARFADRAQNMIAAVKNRLSLKDPPGRDDLLFMTAIPWVSFTSFTHPMRLHPSDSIPRFAWGKFFEDGGHLKMPLSVQAHHALMDGVHLGKYYALFQEYLDQPDQLLSPKSPP